MNLNDFKELKNKIQGLSEMKEVLEWRTVVDEIKHRKYPLSDEDYLKQLSEISEQDITIKTALKVKDLNLSDKELVLLPRGIFYLKSLKSLNVSHNDIISLRAISSMVWIEKLDASFNRITDVEGLSQWKDIKYLNLSNNAIFHGSLIGDYKLTALKKLMNIEYLYLSGNGIDDLSFFNFESKKIKVLDMRDNLIKPSQFDEFEYWRRVNDIDCKLIL